VNDPRAIGDQQIPPHGLMGLVESTDPNWWLWGGSLVMLVAILCGGGLWYLWQRRARLQAAASISQQPQASFAEFLTSLAWPDSLDHQEEFVYQLSFHLRAALERLTYISFTDMTFRELQQNLTSKRAESLPIAANDLLHFFAIAEQIKFQRKRISDEELKHSYALLRDWLEKIDQQLREQELEPRQQPRQEQQSSKERVMA